MRLAKNTYIQVRMRAALSYQLFDKILWSEVLRPLFVHTPLQFWPILSVVVRYKIFVWNPDSEVGELHLDLYHNNYNMHA